jgi:hypothetical protein
MSPVNFEALISEHPASGKALRKLIKWLKKQRSSTVITPREITRNVSLDPADLADAVKVLIDAGILQQVYKVTTPSGVLADAEFEDPRDIPDQLPDRWERTFDTSDSDVVPVFKKIA